MILRDHSSLPWMGRVETAKPSGLGWVTASPPPALRATSPMKGEEGEIR